MRLLKLKIRQRLQVYVLVITSIIFISAVVYISWNARSRALRDTGMLVDSQARTYAEYVSGAFNQDFAVVRALAHAFQVHHEMDQEEWQPLFVNMYYQIFQNNPQFYAIWDSWEYSHILEDWDLPHGRILNYHFRKDGEIGYQQLERSVDGDPPLYGAAKNKGGEMIWEPYPDQLVIGATQTTLMTTLSVPMFHEGNYIGLVAVDIALSELQQMVSEIQPLEGSYAFLVSYEGLYAAHRETHLLEQSLNDYLWQDQSEHQITERIRAGEQFSFTSSHEKDISYYYTFAPIEIANTETPWSIGIAVPVSVIEGESFFDFLTAIVILILGLLIIGLVIYLIAGNISKPIEQITVLMKRLALGQIDTSMKANINTKDELQQMGEAFNTSIQGLIEKTEFSFNIGKGKLDTTLGLLSDEDILGRSLIEMQDALIKARKEEKDRQRENKIRSWATEGYARFAEVLRHNNDNMEELTFHIVQNLVKYIDANQGGVFIINDEEPSDKHLEMTACYAYSRKKFMEKRIEIGEGLVGSCFKEGKTAYMTDIPQSYINITSGLGDESPDALLLVPLILNEVIYGVLELASFNKLEPYQIEFVEKVGESVASTISTVKINVRTAFLLEKSQQQAEEMKAQEEEMRQNMEELHATQEEMERKSSEMEAMLDALDHSSYFAEYDLDGYITSISDSYADFLNISKQDAIGKHHKDDIEFSEEQNKEYQKFWKDLVDGKTIRQIIRLTIQGKKHKMSETYTAIKNKNGEAVKIFKIANILDTDK